MADVTIKPEKFAQTVGEILSKINSEKNATAEE